jgi:hypothetical protein
MAAAGAAVRNTSSGAAPMRCRMRESFMSNRVSRMEERRE